MSDAPATIRVRTASRLHFGLLGWGGIAGREFGGVGLMVEEPGIVLRARSSGEWYGEGPMSGRAVQVGCDVAEAIGGRPCRFTVEHAPAEHVGLGTGTQISLAVARSVAILAGRPDLSVEALATLTGRGRRSGIGLHGFAAGGLIVDGGRARGGGVPPRLSRLEFPEDWPILIVTPHVSAGLHGPDEVRAFSGLPPVPDSVTDRLCRLVLLGLLPSVVDRDLAGFGSALEEIQHMVGLGFSPAQGGIYSRPEVASAADHLRAAGLTGVGQSSWGPCLYAFAPDPDQMASALARLDLPPEWLQVTRAANRGAALGFSTESDPPA